MRARASEVSKHAVYTQSLLSYLDSIPDIVPIHVIASVVQNWKRLFSQGQAFDFETLKNSCEELPQTVKDVIIHEASSFKTQTPQRVRSLDQLFEKPLLCLGTLPILGGNSGMREAPRFGLV